MNVKPILLGVLLACACATAASAQQNNPNTDYPTLPDNTKKTSGRKPPVTSDDYPAYVKAKKDLGKFDYFYLRLSFPFTAGDFNNPMAGTFDSSSMFTLKDKPETKYRIGLNLGTVSHFLDVGTYKLRLGVNVGVDLQAYGKGDAAGVNSHYTSGYVFLANLAVGPQLTYKPSPIMRVAFYARIGATGVYDKYMNYQDNVMSTDASMNAVSTNYEANIQLSNAGLSEDIGADFTWKKLSVGVDYSFFKTHAGSGRVYTPDDVNANTLHHISNAKIITSESYSPIAPTVNFGRLSAHLGFAF